MKKIAEMLGLPEEADEPEIAEAITAMRQAHERLAELDDLKNQNLNLKSEIAGRDAAGAVEAAMKEGKITPSLKDWAQGYAASDAEGFKTFIEKSPVVVPIGETTNGAQEHPPLATDDAQKAVNKALGLNEETYRKYNED